MVPKTSKLPMRDLNLQPNLIKVRDSDGDTFIHTAIIVKQPLVALRYIDAVTDSNWLNIKNKRGQTPLHLATLREQGNVVRRLMSGGANLELRDKDGNTALHIACTKGLSTMADILLKPINYSELDNKYDVPYQQIPQNLNLVNYEGLNCLHLAVNIRNNLIVAKLLHKEADVNSKDGKTGRSILHTACVHNNLVLVKTLLLNKNCNINAKCYHGYSPLNFARFNEHKQIQLELAFAGAKENDDFGFEEEDDDDEMDTITIY